MGVKEIPLRGGRFVAVVDDDDYEYLSQFRWRALIHGTDENRRVYAVRATKIRMHRVIWERWHGDIPPGYEIDHREPGEFCGLDNRRDNLRLATKSQNQANQRKHSNNTSGYRGVWWQKQARLWRVEIWVNRTKRHIGYFSDKEQAAHAYDAAAVAAFGEHARLNFKRERAA
jgi:hypothetical protein